MDVQLPAVPLGEVGERRLVGGGEGSIAAVIGRGT